MPRPAVLLLCFAAQQINNYGLLRAARRPSWLRAFVANILVVMLAWRVAANDATPVPTLAAADVPIGMTGYWRTAVAGTAVTQFPMQVVGLLHDYIYPGLPVILCEALDPLNKHSGPVGGMSGSPVFVDDTIIGAYAYGPIFQKDQALFMATPIELMLQMQTFGAPPLAPLPAAGTGAHTDRERWQLAPLNVCGMSPAAVAWLQRQLQPYGVAVMDGVIGGIDTNISTRMQPGSPLAGVVTYGDICSAAVGTLTYRDGSNIVAFGHPFFRCGAVDMPMAAASILTVTHQVDRSYKIANVGPLVGSIYQDRSPAVAGVLGRFVPMVGVRVRTTHPVLGTNVYHCQAIRHERFTGMALGSIVMSALGAGLEAGANRTVRSRASFVLNTGARICITNIAASWSTDGPIGLPLIATAEAMIQTPWAPAQLNEVDVDLEFLDAVTAVTMTRAWLSAGEARPGECVQVTIACQPFRSNLFMHTVPLTVPRDAHPGIYTLHIADAHAADDLDGVMQANPDSLPALLGLFQRQRQADRVYLKLMAPAAGLVLGANTLAALPPRAAARWRAESVAPLTQTTLAESSCALPAVVRGALTLSLQIK